MLAAAAKIISVARAGGGGDEIARKKGRLTKAVMNGHCFVLAKIESGPAKARKRFNEFLGAREPARDQHFDFRESAKIPTVESNAGFWLIATCRASARRRRLMHFWIDSQNCTETIKSAA